MASKSLPLMLHLSGAKEKNREAVAELRGNFTSLVNFLHRETEI